MCKRLATVVAFKTFYKVTTVFQLMHRLYEQQRASAIGGLFHGLNSRMGSVMIEVMMIHSRKTVQLYSKLQLYGQPGH